MVCVGISLLFHLVRIIYVAKLAFGLSANKSCVDDEWFWNIFHVMLYVELILFVLSLCLFVFMLITGKHKTFIPGSLGGLAGEN